MPSAQEIFLAFAGGILPAIFWLWFWLREDRLHPEPRKFIVKAFLAGMLGVILVIYPEEWIQKTFAGLSIVITLLWAVSEETMKFALSYFSSIRKTYCDEPVDAAIYMITVALGFSALENVLFLLNTISASGAADTLVTTNLRFVGASLLHVVSSGAIGAAMAMSYYKKRPVRIIYAAFGLLTAIALHTCFNLFIMGGNSAETFITFCGVWIAVLVLLAIFEKIKKVRPN